MKSSIHLLIFATFCLCSVNAFAQPSSLRLGMPTQTVKAARAVPVVKKTRIKKSDFTGVMTIGVDMRAERDQQQTTLPRTWPTLSLGVGLKPWMGLIEYASFTENSGNETLNVDRKAETLLLWGQWTAEDSWAIQPYMGLGLGGYRTSADMNLYSERVSAQGKWIEHAAAAVGLRWASITPLYISTEGRVHMNRQLDPNPTLSLVFKIGFILE